MYFRFTYRHSRSFPQIYRQDFQRSPALGQPTSGQPALGQLVPQHSAPPQRAPLQSIAPQTDNATAAKEGGSWFLFTIYVFD